MNRILALDLATHTGWAADLAGERTSGVAHFPVVGRESDGMRFVRFNVWLYGKWKEAKLDIVVYEQSHHRGRAATEVAIGMCTRVQEFCARRGIPFQTVHNSSVKKFATGGGRAEKYAMVKAARMLKASVVSDDEADALWILEFAKSKFAKRLGSIASARSGGSFAESRA